MFAIYKRHQALVAAAALVISLGQLSLAQEKSEAAAPPAGEKLASVEAEIRAGAAAYEKAFNAGDVKAIAAMWAEDGEFTNEYGQKFHGRAAIEKELAGVFANSPGAAITVTVNSIKFISPDVILEEGITQPRNAAGKLGAPINYTALQVKRDGTWKVQTVTDSRPIATGEQRLAGLSWLVGEWKADFGKGTTYRMTCQWIEGKHFLNRTFSVSEGAKVVSTGTQILGWDPNLGQIVSWTFDSEGGLGHELWEERGDQWRIDASSVLADGRTALATNELTKTSDNAFTWRSTERSINEQLLPDTSEVRVERVSK